MIMTVGGERDDGGRAGGSISDGGGCGGNN